MGVLVSPFSPHLLDGSYLSELSSALESAHCESLWIGERPARKSDTARIATTSSESFPRGERYPSPLEWLSFIAAKTTDLKLGTAVLVAPYHHPITLAKRISTLDRLSGGRAIVAVGIGASAEEAVSLDVPIGQRGALTTESIEAMQAIWSATDAARFDGRFFSFRDLDPSPRPMRNGGPPLLVGGNSDAAARRAGRLGLGLFPFACDAERVQELAAIQRTEAIHGGWDSESLELTVMLPENHEAFAALRDAGVTRVIVPAPANGDLTEIQRAIEKAYELSSETARRDV